jgi:hypothetical protein
MGLQAEEFGTHSLRRTKASIIYKGTGNLRAVQILLGHAKSESTVPYLGVDVEDALELSERTENEPSGRRLRSPATSPGSRCSSSLAHWNVTLMSASSSKWLR